MKYRTLFYIGIALGLAIAMAGPAFSQTVASATWHVQKYDVVVTLPADDRVRAISAKATLTVKNVTAAPVGSLTLRISPNADVTSVKINDASVDPIKSEEKIGGTATLQRIAVKFAPVAPDGTVTAVVEYKLNVKENNAVSSFSSVGAQMLPLSYWYPTPNSWFFARGADAAPFSVVVVGGGDTVSSGERRAKDAAFEERLNGQPFFVSGNWDQTESNGVSVYAPKGASADGQKRGAEMAALMVEAKTYFAGVLGNAPAVPFRIVGVRRGAGFADAGTVLVDESVFRRAKIDSLTAMNIVEGVGKTWLGGSVTVNGEGSGAISEGLSRYLATQFLESKYGKDVADIERLRQRNAYAAVSGRDAPMSTVSPLDGFYYPVVANKGAMVWRILAKRVGQTEFASAIKSSLSDGVVTLPELRAAFPMQKDLLDYFFDQTTEMDLMAGTPNRVGAETRVAVRNTGATDVTVDVVGTTATNERIVANTTIRATAFGEVAFKSSSSIVRVEIDADKLYPQTNYADDVAPSETTDSDPLLAAKRAFDKQDYAGAEKTARTLLGGLPRFDDLRILLARALLAEGRTADAEREFKAVLDEKLPTARSLAWANVGLAEAAAKNNQNATARTFAEAAIAADADYGASLAARNVRNKLGASPTPDASVKAFFADFDKAVAAKRKADVDAMILGGEIGKFASGVAGSAETWQTQVVQVDQLGPNTVLVETNMNVRLLNKNDESGTAVYRLVKAGSGWKLAAVDMFEVR